MDDTSLRVNLSGSNIVVAKLLHAPPSGDSTALFDRQRLEAVFRRSERSRLATANLPTLENLTRGADQNFF